MSIAIGGAGGHATGVGNIVLRMRQAGAPLGPIAFVDGQPA